MADNRNNKKTEISDEVITKIKEQIAKLQYGSVTVVVHKGKVVQIDTAERIRMI